jgi:hypothetical protein
MNTITRLEIQKIREKMIDLIKDQSIHLHKSSPKSHGNPDIYTDLGEGYNDTLSVTNGVLSASTFSGKPIPEDQIPIELLGQTLDQLEELAHTPAY